jgi:SET domain-containing protein
MHLYKREIAGRSEAMPRKPLRVGRSKSGLGLFATAPIKKRAFIVEYSGRRITTEESVRREARGARYMFEINSRWTIDGSSRRNLGRYANHACRPNAESDIIKGKIILRAIKNIEPGDEITYDYGPDYYQSYLGKVRCKCSTCTRRRSKARAQRRRRAARRKRRAAKRRSR